MNFIVCLLSAGWLAYLIACGYAAPSLYGCLGLALLALVAQTLEDRK